jgi:hypothetical protein
MTNPTQNVAYLDDIANLQDPELFFDKISAEVDARTPPKNGKRQPPAVNNSTFVASIVATRYVQLEHAHTNVMDLFECHVRNRIHNAYMLASAWKLVLDTLGELKEDGLGNRTAQADLRKHEDLRSRYLVLYDMVSTLVEIGQNKFSVLATTTRESAPLLRMRLIKKCTTTPSSLCSILQDSRWL